MDQSRSLAVLVRLLRLVGLPRSLRCLAVWFRPVGVRAVLWCSVHPDEGVRGSNVWDTRLKRDEPWFGRGTLLREYCVWLVVDLFGLFQLVHECWRRIQRSLCWLS